MNESTEGRASTGSLGPPGPATGMRTAWAGQLGSGDDGRTVTVCGWVDRRREHGEHLAFIDLRDRTGIVQCVVDGAADLRSEYVVRISGTVRPRPTGTENPDLATGAIEVQDCAVEILNAAEPPPFPLHERAAEVDETVRLRYRYVDLRRPPMQRNLAIRSTLYAAMRASMLDQGFTEIETPLLIASTPEGSRDFVVPSRLKPGSFYALPQSPQLFKQLCMVGGVDRYFQIARCLRDEDLRADRQFEFTQLDLEASFVEETDVMGFVEEVLSAGVEAVTGETVGPIPTMTFEEAAERFGSDKPDVRFGMELVELTDAFAGTEARVFQAPCVKGIRLPGGADALTRKQIDELVATCQRWGAKGLAWMRVVAGEGDSGPGLDGGVAKFVSGTEAAAVISALEAEPGDMVFLVADERPLVRHVLGLLRLELGRPPVQEGGLNFVWIHEFPLFEELDERGNAVPVHHAFTMPHPDDIDRLSSDPLSVRSAAYDLVCNGWELGGGSIRVHRPDIQQRVFDAMGISKADAEDQFGFLLDAFRFGAPPHGGFAFGLDRVVALLAGEENIREVIAFPKTQSGSDPLTDAPWPLPAETLAELGLRVPPPPT